MIGENCFNLQNPDCRYFQVDLEVWLSIFFNIFILTSIVLLTLFNYGFLSKGRKVKYEDEWRGKRYELLKPHFYVLGRKLLIQINLNYPQCLNTIWFRLNNDFRCLEEDSSFCSLSPTSTGGSSGASSSSYYYFGERQVTKELFILKKCLIKNLKNQTTEMR